MSGEKKIRVAMQIIGPQDAGKTVLGLALFGGNLGGERYRGIYHSLGWDIEELIEELGTEKGRTVRSRLGIMKKVEEGVTYEVYYIINPGDFYSEGKNYNLKISESVFGKLFRDRAVPVIVADMSRMGNKSYVNILKNKVREYVGENRPRPVVILTHSDKASEVPDLKKILGVEPYKVFTVNANEMLNNVLAGKYNRDFGKNLLESILYSYAEYAKKGR